ncbi:MAG TPA: MFS transporter, partial [Candidatus Nitrosopolaris rasttigaisensis]|nr:MFS transporter [Candidatus Nitrosopolaris rasttigaisensis]
MVSRPKQNDSHKNTDGRSPSVSVKIPASAWKILVILSCLATMVMYAETMLIPAIPDLIKDFHVSYSMSSWILTAYLITGAVMTPIAGKLSDIYGKKRVLLIIMIIYAIGVSIAGFATNIYFLLFARAIQGIGMAMFPIAFSIIRDNFPREKLSIGQGVISSMFASGAVIGLSVGGAIIKHYGWQATFFTIIPIAIALIIVVSRFIRVNEEEVEKERQPEEQELGRLSVETDQKGFESKANKTSNNIGSKDRRSVVDIKGAITLAVTVTSFLLVLTYLETGGNGGTTTGSLQTIIFLIIGIISLALFILLEKRSTNPLVDFRLLLHKTVLPANLIIMIVGFSMFMVFQTIPILARNPVPLGFGEDAISTGNIQLPFAIILLVFGPTSGFIISKLGSMKPVIAGASITSAGFLGLLMFHSTPISLSANLAVLSTGLSLTNVGAMNVTILSTPKQFMGISL